MMPSTRSSQISAAASARSTAWAQLKREEARHYNTDIEIELMRCVKEALDPQANPGEVL